MRALTRMKPGRRGGGSAAVQAQTTAAIRIGQSKGVKRREQMSTIWRQLRSRLTRKCSRSASDPSGFQRSKRRVVASSQALTAKASGGARKPWSLMGITKWGPSQAKPKSIALPVVKYPYLLFKHRPHAPTRIASVRMPADAVPKMRRRSPRCRTRSKALTTQKWARTNGSA